MPEKLGPITVYLSTSQVKALEAEAKQAGQSGVSARIRWLIDRHLSKG